jgi:hypothetical protein
VKEITVLLKSLHRIFIIWCNMKCYGKPMISGESSSPAHRLPYIITNVLVLSQMVNCNLHVVDKLLMSASVSHCIYHIT